MNIVPLLFEDEHLVRTVDMDGEVWLVGVDVCRILGIKDHKQALQRLDPDEIKRCTVPPQVGIVPPQVGNDDQSRDVNIISEAGAYRLVFTSRKPVPIHAPDHPGSRRACCEDAGRTRGDLPVRWMGGTWHSAATVSRRTNH